MTFARSPLISTASPMSPREAKPRRMRRHRTMTLQAAMQRAALEPDALARRGRGCGEEGDEEATTHGRNSSLAAGVVI